MLMVLVLVELSKINSNGWYPANFLYHWCNRAIVTRTYCTLLILRNKSSILAFIFIFRELKSFHLNGRWWFVETSTFKSYNIWRLYLNVSKLSNEIFVIERSIYSQSSNLNKINNKLELILSSYSVLKIELNHKSWIEYNSKWIILVL